METTIFLCFLVCWLYYLQSQQVAAAQELDYCVYVAIPVKVFDQMGFNSDLIHAFKSLKWDSKNRANRCYCSETIAFADCGTGTGSGSDDEFSAKIVDVTYPHERVMKKYVIVILSPWLIYSASFQITKFPTLEWIEDIVPEWTAADVEEFYYEYKDFLAKKIFD